MTAETFLFTSLLIAVSTLILALAMSFQRNQRLNDELHEERDANHAKCIAHITSYVGDQFAANVLRAAAQAWDSIEEKPHIQRLGREQFLPEGPSMPSIWLRDRADTMAEEVRGDQS